MNTGSYLFIYIRNHSDIWVSHLSVPLLPTWCDQGLACQNSEWIYFQFFVSVGLHSEAMAIQSFFRRRFRTSEHKSKKNQCWTMVSFNPAITNAAYNVLLIRTRTQVPYIQGIQVFWSKIVFHLTKLLQGYPIGIVAYVCIWNSQWKFLWNGIRCHLHVS